MYQNIYICVENPEYPEISAPELIIELNLLARG